MGLVFGWLRSVRPTFGRIPEAALWVFDTVGLAVFIGIVGLVGRAELRLGHQGDRAEPPLRRPRRRRHAAHRGALLRAVRPQDEPRPPLRRLRRGRHRHRRPARDPGRGGQQAPRPRLHRPLRDREHPPDRVGTRHRHAHEIGGLHMSPKRVVSLDSRPPRRARRRGAAAPLRAGRRRPGRQARARARRDPRDRRHDRRRPAEGRRGRLQVRQPSRSTPSSRPPPASRSSRASTASRSRRIGSQDMNDFVWVKLAKKANELLAQPDVDGIVVTHGTDTLEETALLPQPRPEERQARRPRRLDAPLHRAERRRARSTSTTPSPSRPTRPRAGAASSWSPTTTVHAGRDIQKTNTTAVQTFVSVDRGPVAEVYYGEDRVPTPAVPAHASKGEFSTRPASTSLPARRHRLRPRRRRRHAREGRGRGRGARASSSRASATATRRRT